MKNIKVLMRVEKDGNTYCWEQFPDGRYYYWMSTPDSNPRTITAEEYRSAVRCEEFNK